MRTEPSFTGSNPPPVKAVALRCRRLYGELCFASGLLALGLALLYRELFCPWLESHKPVLFLLLNHLGWLRTSQEDDHFEIGAASPDIFSDPGFVLFVFACAGFLGAASLILACLAERSDEDTNLSAPGFMLGLAAMLLTVSGLGVLACIAALVTIQRTRRRRSERMAPAVDRT